MNNKVVKNLKNDFFVLAILEIIIVVLSLLFLKSSVVSLIPNIIFAFVLSFGYNMANKARKEAGTIGIVFGILMILTILMGDIIDCLLGIFLASHASKYNKLFK